MESLQHRQQQLNRTLTTWPPSEPTEDQEDEAANLMKSLKGLCPAPPQRKAGEDEEEEALSYTITGGKLTGLKCENMTELCRFTCGLLLLLNPRWQ